MGHDLMCRWLRRDRATSPGTYCSNSFAFGATKSSCRHATLHTPHFTLYTPLRPTTPHYTPLHPALHTLHSTHSTRSALYTPHCTLYSPHSALRTLHNTLYSRACHAICALTPLDAALAMRFATNTQHDTPKVLPVTQNDDGGLQSAAPAANYCACHTKRLSALLQTRASVPRLPRKTTIQPVLTPSKQKKLLQLPP